MLTSSTKRQGVVDHSRPVRGRAGLHGTVADAVAKVGLVAEAVGVDLAVDLGAAEGAALGQHVVDADLLASGCILSETMVPVLSFGEEGGDTVAAHPACWQVIGLDLGRDAACDDDDGDGEGLGHPHRDGLRVWVSDEVEGRLEG